MNRKSLSAEDRRAVDLILDHASIHRAVPSLVTAGAAQLHVTAATRLLSMLDALPAVEPAFDLLARTMGRIDADRPPHIAEPAVTTAATLH